MTYPNIQARSFAPGIGEAVAHRTVSRKIVKDVVPYEQTRVVTSPTYEGLPNVVKALLKDVNLVHSHYDVLDNKDDAYAIKIHVTGQTKIEEWEDVALRVARGSSLLEPALERRDNEFAAMNYHLRQASVLMSGRHLQHGDETQATRPMEVFTNCATSAMTFLEFYLLLSGSGVGRCYDDAMMLVDYKLLPIIVCTLDEGHADRQSGEISSMTQAAAEHMYSRKTIVVHSVEDSREGWAHALEVLEVMAFQGTHRDTVLILDFSRVRPRGSPIMGMQGRPASGPGPIMSAIANIAKLREAKMPRWLATMYADHYAADCVLVGGARRAARMATKTWYDENVFEFIEVKRGGHLWTSNNSVTVDQTFWDAAIKIFPHIEPLLADEDAVRTKLQDMYVEGEITRLERHAGQVFDAVCRNSYGSGEPGFITVSRLTYNDEGIEDLLGGDFAESSRLKLNPETLNLTKALAAAWSKSKYKVITNPCGEIVQSVRRVLRHRRRGSILRRHPGARGIRRVGSTRGQRRSRVVRAPTARQEAQYGNAVG